MRAVRVTIAQKSPKKQVATRNMPLKDAVLLLLKALDEASGQDDYVQLAQVRGGAAYEANIRVGDRLYSITIGYPLWPLVMVCNTLLEKRDAGLCSRITPQDVVMQLQNTRGQGGQSQAAVGRLSIQQCAQLIVELLQTA